MAQTHTASPPLTRTPTEPSLQLLDRIRAEYREMPGLKLTVAQARRLFGLDEATCTTAIAMLTASGFLEVAGDSSLVLAEGRMGR